MNHKKSQAALEFLTTYGWAILVILIAMGALSYLGVFDISKLMPDRCTFGSMLHCESYQLVENGVKLRLQNNLGKPIVIEGVSAEIGNSQVDCNSAAIGEIWSSSDKVKLIEFYCDFDSYAFIKGEKKKIGLTINYTNIKSNFNKVISGQLLSKVEDGVVGFVLDRKRGLLSRWKFEGDPTMGVSDEMGNNDGSCSNCPTGVPGKFGQAYQFNGIDDIIELTTDSVETGTVTVCAWMNTNTLYSWQAIVGNDGFIFGPYSNGNRLALTSDSGGVAIYSATDSLLVNQWYHVCAIRLSNGTGSIYINGIQSGASGDTGTPLSYSGLVIGALRPTGILEFNGLIDEVMIFDKALTPLDIKTLYKTDLS